MPEAKMSGGGLLGKWSFRAGAQQWRKKALSSTPNSYGTDSGGTWRRSSADNQRGLADTCTVRQAFRFWVPRSYRALQVTLTWSLKATGSQCNSLKIGVIHWYLAVPVKMQAQNSVPAAVSELSAKTTPYRSCYNS